MRLSGVRHAVEAPEQSAGVTTLELFFDLVFVFTITQVTAVVREGDYGKALVVLMVTWWMYDGYCWLSNNVGAATLSTRIPMLVSMLGFLVMAVATPDVFDGGAWPFALAYLVVVVVHAAQFARSSLGGSASAIWGVLPLNLGITAGVLTAAALDGGAVWAGWGIAVAILLLAAFRVQGTGFSLRPEHFAERHQLLVIIALGEIVVATGAGAQHRLDDGWVLLAVVLSVALLGALWWVYFGGDDAIAAERLAAATDDELTGHAFWAYSMAHLVHVLGLVLVAAGLHEVVAGPTHDLPAEPALTLGLGTAVFLLAELGFRARLGFGRRLPLVAAAGSCALVAPGYLPGLVELGLLVMVVVVALATDRLLSTRMAA
jgi:low temperature requirement protein LtrA